MKKTQLKVLNQCSEEELLQQAQHELEVLQQKQIEYDPEFPTYSNAPNDFDEAMEIQAIQELERNGTRVNQSVFTVLMALHRIGKYRKSGYFLTRFNEIKMHSKYLDRETIRNALRFLHDNKIIIFIVGRGFRETLIVLRMFNEISNQNYKTKILAKNLLIKQGNSIQLNPKYATELFQKMSNKNQNKVRKNYFYKPVGGIIHHTVGGKIPQTVGGKIPPTQSPSYINNNINNNNINKKENLIKEKENSNLEKENHNQDIKETNPSYVPETRPQPPVDERTVNILISNTEKNILNLFDELLSMKTKFSQINLVHLDPTPENPHGLAQIKPYSASQRQDISNLCEVIRCNLRFISEKKRQLGLSVFEKSYTDEELLRLCSQPEAIQRRIF